MAWLSGWGKRVKLTIDNTDIDGALENFPILVYLSIASGRLDDDVSFVFDELTADANRKKIAVTTTDGTTECYVEIEKWDDANEQAWLWVKAPAIASDADTDLYLYYDSAHADNDTYVGDTNSVVAESVWDTNFVFVSHMRDGASTSAIYDSTNNNNDGAKQAANEPIVTTAGKIADAQSFDGSNDLIGLGSNATLKPVTNITLEAWVYPNASQVSYADIMGGHQNNQGYVVQQNSTTANQYYLAYRNVSEAWQGTGITTQLTASVWQHFVTIKDGTTIRHYVNGAAGSNGACAKDINYDVGEPIYIGTGFTPGSRHYGGLIDEVRISNVVRSAAWVKATYETGRDDLLDWGSEETSSTIYNESLTDGIKSGETITAGMVYGISLTDGLKGGDTHAPRMTYGLATLDGMKAGDTNTVYGVFVNALTDGIKSGDSHMVGQVLGLTMADGIKQGDAITLSQILGVIIGDGVKSGDTLTVGQVLNTLLVDGIKAGDTAIIGQVLGLILADGVKSGDSLTNLVTLLNLLTDGLKVGDVTTPSQTLGIAITDGIKSGDTPTVGQVLSILLSDGIKAGDISIDRLIYNILVGDGIKVGDINLSRLSRILQLIVYLRSRAMTGNIKNRSAVVNLKGRSVSSLVNTRTITVNLRGRSITTNLKA